MTPEDRVSARRAGMARRGISKRGDGIADVAILAAYRRGWSTTQIAFAGGISHQAVTQRLRRLAVMPNQRNRGRSHSKTRRFWRCAVCGSKSWSAPSRLAHGLEHVCSIECLREFRRMITDEMVDHAVDMRWAGKMWRSISIELRHPVQAIQSRIWKRLYLSAMLDIPTVESIWNPGGKRGKSSWSWIERNTGLTATETGAAIKTPIYRNQRSAWGSSNRMKREDNDVA